MNKEILKYHFVQRKILSRTSPALTFLSPSRLPACLHSSPASLPDGSGLPQQLLSPSHFRRYDEMAEISRGIEKQKIKLDSLRWQTRQGISSIAFQRLRVDAEQLSKGREFGLKKAGMHSKLL